MKMHFDNRHHLLAVLYLAFSFATASIASGNNFSGSDDFSELTNFWSNDITTGKGTFVLSDGKLNFTSTSFSNNEQAGRYWEHSYGSYTEDWSVQMDVFLGTFSMSSGQWASASISVSKHRDNTQDFARIILSRYGTSSRFFHADAYDNGLSLGSRQSTTTSTTASLGINYEASTQTITVAYDLDGSSNGYLFTPLFLINADTVNDPYFAISSDTFEVSIGVQTTIPISIGQITIDNFIARPTQLAIVPEPSTTFLILFANFILCFLLKKPNMLVRL